MERGEVMKIEELKIDECRKILSNSILGRIACASGNQPYVVPFNFVFDGREYLYAFSTIGRKIRWMRENPLVCVEIEEIVNQYNWTTLVIFGSYEELPDEPEFERQRIYAHELLSRRPMWWQPAYVAGTHREQSGDIPVYFRIHIEKITGHRAAPESFETKVPRTAPIVGEQKNEWLNFRLRDRIF